MGLFSQTNGGASTGVTVYPSASVRALGFSVGSDRSGGTQSKGQIEELETYNYPLSASVVLAKYTNTVNAFMAVDTDYDGRTDAQELLEFTDPVNAESVLPVQLASWRFDSTNFVGDQAQSP